MQSFEHSFQAFRQSRRQTGDVTCSGKTAEMQKLRRPQFYLILLEFLIDQKIKWTIFND